MKSSTPEASPGPFPSLGVAIWQPGPGGDSPRARLAALDRALAARGNGRVDVVLCPELFSCGYGAGDGFRRLAETCDGSFARAAGKLARRHGCTIVYGYAERDATDATLYNAAAAIGLDGRLLANRRKALLPTEYERSWFAAGDHGPTFLDVGGWKVALLICYEVEFPELVRAAAAGGAALVLVPTALTGDWNVVSRRVVPARAFENGIFLAYANHGAPDGTFAFAGESCIVGPDGQDLARSGPGGVLMTATLDPAVLHRMRARLPYLQDSAGLGAARPLAPPTGARTT